MVIIPIKEPFPVCFPREVLKNAAAFPYSLFLPLLGRGQLCSQDLSTHLHPFLGYFTHFGGISPLFGGHLISFLGYFTPFGGYFTPLLGISPLFWGISPPFLALHPFGGIPSPFWGISLIFWVFHASFWMLPCGINTGDVPSLSPSVPQAPQGGFRGENRPFWKQESGRFWKMGMSGGSTCGPRAFPRILDFGSVSGLLPTAAPHPTAHPR